MSKFLLLTPFEKTYLRQSFKNPVMMQAECRDCFAGQCKAQLDWHFSRYKLRLTMTESGLV